ncbi:hypothetical protein BHM03_00042218 [Ensete ventricosum]|nr:hypothetical protein BHM03_00042218 [Ensete ventricosum]
MVSDQLGTRRMTRVVLVSTTHSLPPSPFAPISEPFTTPNPTGSLSPLELPTPPPPRIATAGGPEEMDARIGASGRSPSAGRS